MARITKETIDEIFNRMDIVDIVSGYLSLKKKGKDYWAPCPFHNEKSPSFAVAPAKGIYKCFGCGEAGGPIDFVMKMDGVGYAEALRQIATKYGIEIKEERVSDTQQEEQNVKDSLYILLNQAKDFYKKQLTESDEGKSLGLSYFKERGFLDSTIADFDLGYAPDAWSSFTDYALKNGFELEYLDKSGLTIVKAEENKKYDRFRGRVIFPIHNVSGKVVGFGARILKKSDKEPKYINSPETDVYVKSKILYGIFQAKNAIRQVENCYLTEGYTDVISLHQAGIKNVLASSGTSLTVDQIRLIGRFSENITVLYDGDPAGIKASLRGIDLILEEGLNVKAVLLPEQEDPDSYVKKVGAAGFKEYVDTHAVHFIQFKISLFKNEIEKDPLRKAEVIRDVVESISKIPDSIKRSVFIKECGKLLEMDEQTLISELNKILLKKRKKGNEPQQETTSELQQLVDLATVAPAETTSVFSREYQEAEIVRLLLKYGSEKVSGEQTIAQYFISELDNVVFSTPIYSKIFEIFRIANSRGELPDFMDVIESDPEQRNAIIGMIADKYSKPSEKGWAKFNTIVKNEEERLDKVMPSAIYRLKRKFLIEAKNKVDEQLLNKEITVEQEQAIMNISKELKSSEMIVAKILGTVLG